MIIFPIFFAIDYFFFANFLHIGFFGFSADHFLGASRVTAISTNIAELRLPKSQPRSGFLPRIVRAKIELRATQISCTFEKRAFIVPYVDWGDP